MSTLTKQRVVFVGLVIFTLWPLAHHMLVLKYGINPWKLAGWSMYCVRPAPIRVDVLTRGDAMPDGWREALPLPLQNASDKFSQDRRMWGLLETPDAVAMAAFETAPQLDFVRIRVQDRRLDRDTAYIVEAFHDYDYQRPVPVQVAGAE